MPFATAGSVDFTIDRIIPKSCTIFNFYSNHVIIRTLLVAFIGGSKIKDSICNGVRIVPNRMCCKSVASGLCWDTDCLNNPCEMHPDGTSVKNRSVEPTLRVKTLRKSDWLR